MEDNKYNRFYKDKWENDLLEILRAHLCGEATIASDWYDALLIHMEQRNMSDKARERRDHLLATDPEILKQEAAASAAEAQNKQRGVVDGGTSNYNALIILLNILGAFNLIVTIIQVIAIAYGRQPFWPCVHALLEGLTLSAGIWGLAAIIRLLQKMANKASRKDSM